MNSTIVNKNVKTTSAYIGYLILDEFRKSKSKKLTIYKISSVLNKNGLKHQRQLILGLTFLYSTGIISFEEPYICVN